MLPAGTAGSPAGTPPPSAASWYDGFVGIAYRYFDLRMNVAPLFEDKGRATEMWRETIHWWPDHAIRLRFVEEDGGGGDDGGNTGPKKYWFILGADSLRMDTNRAFYKLLDVSPSYERFKKGHGGEAYLRLGVFTKKFKGDVKEDAVCECGHEMYDHGEDTPAEDCLYEDCDCKRFESFEVNLLWKKKTVTDIRFLNESEARDDALAWNCLQRNKYGPG